MNAEERRIAQLKISVRQIGQAIKNIRKARRGADFHLDLGLKEFCRVLDNQLVDLSTLIGILKSKAGAQTE